MKPYKRIKVDNEAYLKKLVHYIHYNPVEAAMVNLPLTGSSHLIKPLFLQSKA